MKKILNTVFALLLIAAGFVGSIVLFFFVVPEGSRAQDYLLAIVLLVTGYFVFRFVHAFLHELGHLFFGLANGFRLYEIAVGPFRFLRVGKRLRFRFHRNKYGGMVMMANTRTDRLYERYFRLTLGGVLFSCLAAVGAACLAYFTRGINFFAWCVLLAGVPASFQLVALNAFAFDNDGTYSDGAVLSGIRRREVAVQLNVVLMNIQGMLCAGQSPRELDRAVFYDVPEGTGVNHVQLLNYRYVYELDAGRLEEAVRLSDEIAAQFNELPEIYRPGILTDIFYTELVLKGDVTRAKNIWVGVEKYIGHDLNICNLRIRMAYELYIKENPRLALATAKTALQVKDEFIIPGIAKMEERLIAGLTEEAERRAEQLAKKPLVDDLPEYKG